MKLRQLIAVHAPSLGWTQNQAIEIAKIVGQGVDDFKAPGRGPGGGPDATPYNAALMVLAALASHGPQTRMAGVVQRLYVTRPAGSDSGVAAIVGDPEARPENPWAVCPATGAPCFGDALKAILASSALADRVASIDVRRGANDATIHMTDGTVSRFVDDYEARQIEHIDAQGDIRAIATIGGRLLADIARDLAQGVGA